MRAASDSPSNDDSKLEDGERGSPDKVTSYRPSREPSPIEGATVTVVPKANVVGELTEESSHFGGAK